MWYIVVYFIIGIILSIYWWNKEYEEDYEKLKKMNEVDESGTMIFLMFLTVFWPIKFIKNLINKRL